MYTQLCVQRVPIFFFFGYLFRVQLIVVSSGRCVNEWECVYRIIEREKKERDGKERERESGACEEQLFVCGGCQSVISPRKLRAQDAPRSGNLLDGN
jgi:hypothetical protein